MKLSHIAASVALAAASLGASAATFTDLEQEHDGNVVRYTLNGSSSSVRTHERIGILDSGSSFAAFCIELRVPYGSMPAATVESFTPDQADQLSRLFTGANWVSFAWETDGVADNDTAKITALQVGVWEIVYDTKFDLTAGSFSVIAADVTAYGGMITDWMAAGNTLMADNIFAVRDGLSGQQGNKQDLVIAVPEPSTYALMIAGLGAIGFVARRRARRG